MQVVCKKKNHFHTHGVSFSNFEKTHAFLSFLEKDKTTRLFVFFSKKTKRRKTTHHEYENDFFFLQTTCIEK